MEKIVPFLKKARGAFEKACRTPDHSAAFSRADASANRLICVLSYLSFLAVVPLIAASKSKYARFHAMQGLLLAVMEAVCALILGILDSLPLIGWLFAVARWILNIGFVLLSLFGIKSVLEGSAKELPFLGKYVSDR